MPEGRPCAGSAGAVQREAVGGASAGQSAWEAAYLRFETPEEETRKFVRRLRRAGALEWSRDISIVELFCGRGSGLRALERLGFSRVCGVDLSPALAAHSFDRRRIAVGDCRQLPYAKSSRDVAVVQGGLHHLQRVPQDLELTLAEIRRVLKERGLLVVVEPWQTPFLTFAHFLGNSRVAGRLSGKIAALGSMVEEEGDTYRRWLAQPQRILDCFRDFFREERCRVAWGKLLFVGRKVSTEPASG